jgi:hypothetical protein
VTVAAVVVVLLGGAALATPRGPAQPRPLPPAPPVALDVHDAVRAEALGRSGITLSAGWQPTGLIDTRRIVPPVGDPWELADGSDGVGAWEDLLPRLRLLYDSEGRLLVEDAVVVLDPAHCYRLARTVRRLGVGLPPPIGPTIAGQLEAWLEPPYFSGVRNPVGRGPCSGTDRSQQGFAIEQAEPLDCAVPGREVICFTLAKWRHDFGPRDVWTSTHRVFDVTTGARLDDAELHPDLDVIAFGSLLDEAICALGGRCDGVAMREGRIHPTRTTLIAEFSPGEAADPVHGSLRLTIPRSALPRLP